MTAMVPAIVVPDEYTWTMAGVDPAGLGVEPVFDVAAARRVLLPDRVPDALAEPLRDLFSALPSSAGPVDSELAFAGDVDASHLQGAHGRGSQDADEHTRRKQDHAGHHDHEHHGAPGAHDGHGDHGRHGRHESHGDHEGDGSHDDGSHNEHGGHDDHGGHDHDDMMAIVGEPSADGLVMESIEFRVGPLATPLPAGVVADVTLDGDVVAECTLTALLMNGHPPDPLAPKAWERVAAAAGGPPSDPWPALAAAEVERALSHTAWLRAFGRVLGWRALVERVGAAIPLVLEARSLRRSDLAGAEVALAELTQFAERSRRLRWRTAGRAYVSSDDALGLGLAGPTARASGLPDDARSDDPLYRQIGFEPLVRSEGDAWARTVLRAAESVAALRLASEAAAESALLDAPLASVVEGPRGPLRATSEGPEAPGESALLAVAGATAVGAEWAAAVVGIASFDVSPWRVGR